MIKEFSGFEMPKDNASKQILKKVIQRNAKDIASKRLQYLLVANPLTAFLYITLWPSSTASDEEMGTAYQPWVEKVQKEYENEKNKKEESKCKEGLYRGQGLRATSQTSGAEIRAGSDYEGTRQGDGYKGLYLSIMNSYNTHKSNKEICQNHMGYHFSSRENKPDPENLFMVSFECCKEEIKEFSFPGISRLDNEEIEQFKQMGFKVLVAYRSTPTPEYAILDNTILTDIEKIGTYDYTLSREENARILCAKL